MTGEVFILAIMTVDGKNETSAPCVTNAAAYIFSKFRGGKEVKWEKNQKRE